MYVYIRDWVALDPAEFEYMIQLILFSVKQVTNFNEGL
jgi:hypothetical protein